MDDRDKAQELHQQAQLLSDEGKDDEAIKLYHEAIDLDPGKSESFYNIGLIYKYRGDWQESFEWNRRANQLDPSDESSRWNLAIAATALRDWKVARQAWIDQGISLDGDEGPIEMNFGPAPVRLNANVGGEVVWATRIDPVRARIDNVPYPDSGFRFGDVVLQLFERSSFFTVEVNVLAPSNDDLEKLEQIFAGADVPLEIWSKNVRAICRQCSEGIPREHHGCDLDEADSNEHRVGIAASDSGNVEALLTRWQSGSGGTVVSMVKHLQQ
jgi:tetratricopeptide (TPR) repeat protein